MIKSSKMRENRHQGTFGVISFHAGVHFRECHLLMYDLKLRYIIIWGDACTFFRHRNGFKVPLLV